MEVQASGPLPCGESANTTNPDATDPPSPKDYPLTSPDRDFHDTWVRVVDMLIAGTDVPDGEPQPLKPNHKALLNSVTPVGQVNGFVLLTTKSELVQELVKNQLASRIESSLEKITGHEQQVVITVPDDGAHGDSTAMPANLHSAATEVSPRQGGHPAAGAARREPNDWRTLEFERDARESAALDGLPESTGTPYPSQSPGGRTHPSHPPQQQYQHDQQSQFPPRTVSTPATGGMQGTASDLFGRGKYPLHGMGDPMKKPVEEPTLNPKYTFDTFVIGPQNRFAAAAAAAVAEQPARAYNPLFISGGSGLGKTHLLHAIGHYATALDPKLRVRYVSSEEFTNDFINSVRDDAQESFKRRYRDLDILIVDDIQFLEGKEGTQEEFFHTFNALHQADRQIVLSSDRPPRELKTLEERLRTRFEWGLTPDLQLPDLETRIAILSKKAQLDRLNVPHDVLQFIAEHTASSIRELEGRLLQVTAQASLLKMPISLQLAEEIIGSDSAEVEITPDIIIAATAEFYGLTVPDLTGSGKTRPVSHARQVAMYLTRSLIDISLPAIGKVFGGRDHSTVLYAHRKIQKEISDKRATRDQVNDLTTRIRERSRTRG